MSGIVLAGYLLLAFAAAVGLALGLCRSAADADHDLKFRTVGTPPAQPRHPSRKADADTAGDGHLAHPVPPSPASLSTEVNQ